MAKKTKIEVAEAFTEGCWELWAGAEGWSKLAPPLVRTIGERLVVADARGFEFTNDDEAWSLDLVLSPKAAETFLNALPVGFDPIEFGFERVG